MAPLSPACLRFRLPRSTDSLWKTGLTDATESHNTPYDPLQIGRSPHGGELPFSLTFSRTPLRRRCLNRRPARPRQQRRALSPLEQRRDQLVPAANLKPIAQHPLMARRELHIPIAADELEFQHRVRVPIPGFGVLDDHLRPGNAPGLLFG